MVISGDKEIDNVPASKRKTSQAIIKIDSKEPVTVRETNVQETTKQFSDEFNPLKYNASLEVTPSESIIVSETNADQDIAETEISPNQSKEARVTLTTHEVAITQEIQPSYREEEIQGTKIPPTARAEPKFITQEGISVTEVTQAHSEEVVPELVKPIPMSPRVEIPSSESIEVTETFSEIKPEKYYPELIVPTEVADRSVVPGNKLVQKSEILLPEKEGTFYPEKIPEGKHADVNLALDKSIIVYEQEVHEKEEGFLPEKEVAKTKISASFTPFESLQVMEVQEELKEQEFLIDKVDSKKVNIVVDDKESVVSTINTPIEREQNLEPDSSPSLKKADSNFECLETPNVSEILTHESELTFESDKGPKGVYPMTSVQPLESIEIMETQTSDSPADFINPLKYSIDKANRTFETVESKEVTQVIPQEKESPLKINEIPKLESVTQDINQYKSIQVTHTLLAEKEDILKVPQIPESHKGKAVPGQPLHSIIVEEIQTENTTGEVEKESVPTQTVQIKQDLHQETIIQEIICDEALSESSVQKPITKSADFKLVAEEGVEITEVLLNEKEQEYEQPKFPAQVFAEKSIRHQEAIQSSEVLSSYQSSRFSPEKVSKSVATAGTNPLESISVTQYETSEKESILPKDVHPEKKIATIDYHDEKQEVCITQVETAEKEQNLVIKEAPISFVAGASISGHKIAIKTEVIADQHFEDFTISEETKRLATVENIPHQEVVVTEVNISEQEKELDNMKPGSKEATITFIPEEAINVTEIIPADNENVLVKDKIPLSQTATTLVLIQEIAEKSEIIPNVSTGVFKQMSPESAQANVSHDSFQHLVQSELITDERESELDDSVKLSLKSAYLNFEEEQALSVTEVNITDSESPIAEKQIPKESFATVDITGQKVASILESFVETNTGEVEQFNPIFSKAKPENIPFEAIVNTEILASEYEGKLNPDVKPDIKKASTSLNEEIGITVSIVTCEDKEQALEKEKYREESGHLSQIGSHPVALSSEILILRSTSEFETIKPKATYAEVNQSTHESIIQNEVSSHEKESSFDEILKSKPEQAHIAFEEGKGTTIFEIVTAQAEEEFKKEHIPGKKCATVNVSEHIAAQTEEVICDTALNDLSIKDMKSDKASVTHNLIESVIASEVEVTEKEGEYYGEKITKDQQSANLIYDENEALKIPVVSQNILEEKEENFDVNINPASKTASVRLEEPRNIPSIGEIAVLEGTIPYKVESVVERYATADIQNQTVVAQQYEAMTNVSEGQIIVEKPKTVKASIQQDTFEGIFNTEVIIQDTESKFNDEFKPSSKIADVNIETFEVASTLQPDVLDNEQNYTIEEPEEQKAKTEFITKHVAQKVEIIPEQDVSEISSSTTETSEAKTTIIPFTSLTQSTTEVSESEKEFKDKFKPVEKTASIKITEDTSINVSEINFAEKEELLPAPEKQVSLHAHPNITSQEVVVITETIPSLSVSDVQENVKHDLNKATIDQSTFTGLTQTQVHVLDKEQDFKQPTGITTQLASITFQESQSINVITHTPTDTADEFNVSEKPSKVSAKIQIPTRDSIQETEVRAESQTELLNIDQPKSYNVFPSQNFFESIGVLENITQESESYLKDKEIIQTTKATFKLEPQEVISVSTIDVQEKEDLLPVTELPILSKATPNVSERKVAQKSEIIPESSTGILYDEKMKPGNAFATTVPLEHLIQTQPSVMEPSEMDFQTPQSDLKIGTLGIEGERKVAIKSEVLVDEKEKELSLLNKRKHEKATRDISNQESLMSSEVVPLEKEESLTDFVAPKKVSATKEFIPHESIEQSEIHVQESGNNLSIEKIKDDQKIEGTFQELVSVNVQELMVQEKEGDVKIPRLPTPETANVELTQLQGLTSTEVISDSSLTDIPSSSVVFEFAKRGMPAQQQSVEVTIAPAHESEGLLVEGTVPSATAPVVIEPLECVQITEITPEENLGKLYLLHILLNCLIKTFMIVYSMYVYVA